MTQKEFISNVKKVKSNRLHMINNSYGVKESYRYFLKNTDNIDISESSYRKVLQELNKKIRDCISKGEDFVLPYNMGLIEVRKKHAVKKFIDGKFVTNLPVDWNATLQLWYEDDESMANKTVVRCNNPFIFMIRYNKFKCKYKNQSYIEFSANRELKNMVRDNINNNNIDAYLIYGKS